uniref:Uncharacterized protein n=1 Tax=Peromyscus maniculatus bairdii TaxID=230844 RepID=A0A8C8ULU8_PERMB
MELPTPFFLEGSPLDLVKVSQGCVFCLHVCLGIVCIPGSHRSQKRRSDLLEMELQIIVRCHVGARNQTPVL